MRRFIPVVVGAIVGSLVLTGCLPEGKAKPRMVMFVGVDISGSFVKSGHFQDGLAFLATYLQSHIEGLGELEKPDELFVGSLGGSAPNEPKTFYPIQTFEHLTAKEKKKKLLEIFESEKQNRYTDFNSFFKHVAETVQQRKLLLRPISIILITDGKPDSPTKDGKLNFRKLDFKPLERLSRNITVRVLYTSAVVGSGWRNQVPRRRVKVWTQDAEVMAYWKDSHILEAGKPLKDQDKFFEWVRENVDFSVRSRSVN